MIDGQKVAVTEIGTETGIGMIETGIGTGTGIARGIGTVHEIVIGNARGPDWRSASNPPQGPSTHCFGYKTMSTVSELLPMCSIGP